MKRLSFILLPLLASPAAAQMPPPVHAQAPAEPNAIPLYPDMKAPKGTIFVTTPGTTSPTV